MQPPPYVRRWLPAAWVGAAVLLVLAACARSGESESGQPAASPPATTSSAVPTALPRTLPTAAMATALGCPRGMAIAVTYRGTMTTRTPALLVVAHCDSGAGSPPSGVFEVVATATGGSEVRLTLVRADQELQVRHVTLTARSVVVTAMGYSTATVPRCCPDRHVTLTWSVGGDALTPGPASVSG